MGVFTYRLNVEERSLQDEEQTILFRLSTLFNPVILFCIFLSEVIFINIHIRESLGPWSM